MSESFYYYQKVGFLVHEDIDDGLRWLLRYVLPFTLPILLGIWERFFNKTIDQGEIVFLMTESRLPRITSTYGAEVNYIIYKESGWWDIFRIPFDKNDVRYDAVKKEHQILNVKMDDEIEEYTFSHGLLTRIK